MWGQLAPKLDMALSEPSSKLKNIEHSGKDASFQHVRRSPQNLPGLGPTWAQADNLAQLGRKLRYLGRSWSLSWRHFVVLG